MRKLREKLFKLFDYKSGGKVNFIFDLIMIILLGIGLTLRILVPYVDGDWFRVAVGYTEFFLVIIFSIEYLLRVFVGSLRYPKYSTAKGTLRYMVSFFAIVDLLAIVPYYIRVLKINTYAIRLLRIVNFFFARRKKSGTDIQIIEVIKVKRQELLSSLALLLVLIFISGVLMFYVESPVQPDKFSNIFDAFWWAIITFTTIGYGDIYPITVIGRLIAGAISILGIGLIAIPTGIISGGFSELTEQKKVKDSTTTLSLTRDEEYELRRYAEYLISKRQQNCNVVEEDDDSKQTKTQMGAD